MLLPFGHIGGLPFGHIGGRTTPATWVAYELTI